MNMKIITVLVNTEFKEMITINKNVNNDEHDDNAANDKTN